MSPRRSPGEATFTHEYDPTGEESLSKVIVRLVAVATDREALALRPLGEVVDVDALDRLFAAVDHSQVPAVASFRYEGFRVEVDGEGTVRLYEEAA